MKNYLMYIIIVSLCVSVLNLLIPKGKGLYKYIKLIGMLVILVSIISPIPEILDKFDMDILDEIRGDILNNDGTDNIEYSEMLNEYLHTYSIEQYKLQIKELLYDKFGIDKNECDINVNIISEEGKLEVSDLQILLLGKAIFKNPYEIEDYFKELIGCDCRVLIKSVKEGI